VFSSDNAKTEYLKTYSSRFVLVNAID